MSRLIPLPALILAVSTTGVSAKTVTALTGRQVFAHTCHTCHARGIAGAPKFGNRDAWRRHLAKGIKILDEHAIRGYYGYSFMPHKGGDESLSDSEVRAAVRYMVAAVRSRGRALDPHQ